ncbi:hypothetical protein M501DRAFT_880664 [Patellaria atrata CBS 101060]|uniref:Uncharacterized protein n=1 Tax=Patellaria atrata CBS 101060 TaxID=1346257 RepID=A0A9P4VMB8_9PEZI|nr:hypothetical protein M501DRAFT_880664 [Patellaria atrata CBS 101060]
MSSHPFDRPQRPSLPQLPASASSSATSTASNSAFQSSSSLPSLQTTSTMSATSPTYSASSSHASATSPQTLFFQRPGPLPSPTSQQQAAQGPYFGSLGGTQGPNGAGAAQRSQAFGGNDILAEAAKRAQMAVLMRDMEGVEL